MFNKRTYSTHYFLTAILFKFTWPNGLCNKNKHTYDLFFINVFASGEHYALVAYTNLFENCPKRTLKYWKIFNSAPICKVANLQPYTPIPKFIHDKTYDTKNMFWIKNM